MTPAIQLTLLLLVVGTYPETPCDALPTDSAAKDASIFELNPLVPCNGRRYFTDTDLARNQADAKTYCDRFGMLLADFRTLEEFQCVRGQLNANLYWTDWRNSWNRSCVVSDNERYFPNGVYLDSTVKLGLLISNRERLWSRVDTETHNTLCMSR